MTQDAGCGVKRGAVNHATRSVEVSEVLWLTEVKPSIRLQAAGGHTEVGILVRGLKTESEGPYEVGVNKSLHNRLLPGIGRIVMVFTLSFTYPSSLMSFPMSHWEYKEPEERLRLEFMLTRQMQTFTISLTWHACSPAPFFSALSQALALSYR